MIKPKLLLFVLLSVVAMPSIAAEDEGFKNPLSTIVIDDREDLALFEQSSLAALDIFDPFEFWNRRVYHFNQRFDESVFQPVLKGYRFVLPNPVRRSVSHFFGNLGDVNSLANSLLQFKLKRSAHITGRVIVNTTVGLVGFFDPASRMGLGKQTEDFGQTLGFYRVPAGPYLILPVLGPSNFRDAGGRVVDFVGNEQINYLNVADTTRRHPYILGVYIVNERYITDFEYGQMNSPFEYEKLRYVYSRARMLQISD